MDESAAWKKVGRKLGEARERARLTKRGAAAKAGFSEATWRKIEDGEERPAPGVVIPPRISDRVLEAACRAVDVEPADMFKALGRPYLPSREPADRAPLPATLVEKLERLTPARREAIERIVDDLFETE